MSDNRLAALIWLVVEVALIATAAVFGLNGHPGLAVLLIVCAGCLKVKIGEGSCE